MVRLGPRLPRPPWQDDDGGPNTLLAGRLPKGQALLLTAASMDEAPREMDFSFRVATSP